MRRVTYLLLSGMLLAGCAWHHAKPAKTDAGGKVIMTPETTRTGQVLRVDANARFVIVNFPLGGVPSIGETLDAYRQGLKVGEVKVTGPQQDENTVADIVTGELRVGDELRSR